MGSGIVMLMGGDGDGSDGMMVVMVMIDGDGAVVMMKKSHRPIVPALGSKRHGLPQNLRIGG